MEIKKIANDDISSSGGSCLAKLEILRRTGRSNHMVPDEVSLEFKLNLRSSMDLGVESLLISLFKIFLFKWLHVTFKIYVLKKFKKKFGPMIIYQKNSLILLDLSCCYLSFYIYQINMLA